MRKMLNNNELKLRPHCGRNYEHIVFAIGKTKKGIVYWLKKTP